jgi:hypothetical protein
MAKAQTAAANRAAAKKAAAVARKAAAAARKAAAVAKKAVAAAKQADGVAKKAAAAAKRAAARDPRFSPFLLVHQPMCNDLNEIFSEENIVEAREIFIDLLNSEDYAGGNVKFGSIARGLLEEWNSRYQTNYDPPKDGYEEDGEGTESNGATAGREMRTEIARALNLRGGKDEPPRVAELKLGLFEGPDFQMVTRDYKTASNRDGLIILLFCKK